MKNDRDGFDYPAIHGYRRDILYTVEGWDLIGSDLGMWESIMSHTCKTKEGRVVFRYGSYIASLTPAGCGYCDTDVPEELIGAWKLHNWDVIQRVKE